MQRVLEDPRIVKRAAPDAHARAAGFIKHLLRGRRRDDVAVADDRNTLNGRHHGADAREVDGAAKTLCACAAMNKNRLHAHVFQCAGQIGRSEVIVIPAESHLGGDGNFHGVDHAADERGGFVQFRHHGRAAADLADLLDRAAHVDIHGRDADGFEIRRGVAHFLRHAAEELHGERGIGGVGFDQLERLGFLFEQRAGVDEIGGAKPHAADFAQHEAEGQVGVTRQRREKQIRGQGQRAKTHQPHPSRTNEWRHAKALTGMSAGMDRSGKRRSYRWGKIW